MIQKKHRSVLIKRGIIIISLILFIYLLLLFADNANAVERYYTNGFYVFVCKVLHPVFNIFPFSIGDVLYPLAIILLVYKLIRIIALCFKKLFVQAGIIALGIVIAVQGAIVLFYLFWGLNYFRPSAAERLNLRDSTFTTVQLKQVTAILIDSANSTRARVTQSDLKQSNTEIYASATNAINKLSETSVQFNTYNPKIKPSLLTSLLNYIGTSGYYNPFTGEAQMNYQMPVFNRPFVACHEMAHQMGYGPEDEANFVGFMAAKNSHNRLLRYSAYNLAINEFMRTLRYTDSLAFKQLKTQISEPVLSDFKEERLYWLSYQNKLNTVTSIFYDNFLKANNQPQGLETYNRMVLLVMAMYNKENLNGK